MFVIRNTSDSDIVFDDLRVILGPGKEIDLDKTVSRTLSEHSEKLKMELLRKPPRIKIVNKDAHELAGGAIHPVSTPFAPIVDTSALQQMENRLAAKMSQKDAQIQQLTGAIHALVEKLGNQTIQTVKEESAASKAVDDSSSDEMSVDIQSRIHAKAVERMAKDVTGSIEQESKREKDESLDKDLGELKNLRLK